MVGAIDERKLLLKEIARMDQSYDPAVQMIKIPFSSPGYHTTLTAEACPWVHQTNATAIYAAALLDGGGPDRDSRAFSVLGRLIELQDQDPASPTYGIWPWFYEESLQQMSPPDWNWADFIGKQLALSVLRHGDRMPEELGGLVRHAVRCAGESIIRRNMGPHYTNIAIMGAFVALVAGEVYGWEDMREYGLNRLQKVWEHVSALGTFQEFNSPAYSRIAVVELARIRQAARSPLARELAGKLLDQAWRMIAEHFHPATREWAGPHSRSYGVQMRDVERAFLQLGTGNRVCYFAWEELPYVVEYYGNDIRCPDPYLGWFSDHGERRLAQRYQLDNETGREKHAYTAMTPDYAIGSFSEEIMWNQTRGLLAFIPNQGRTASMRLRFLHDGYDYCSAVLKTCHAGRNSPPAGEGAAGSVWEGEDVLLGIRFLTDGGDSHPNLDKTGGAIEAADFRLRVEFGGELEGVSASAEGQEVIVRIGRTVVHLRTLYAAFCGSEADLLPDGPPAWLISREEGMFACDLVLYSGAAMRMDFRTLEQAALLFLLRIGRDAVAPAVKVEAKAAGETAAAVLTLPNGAEERLVISVKPGCF
ncbi:hypothetical protein [Paenibacillus sp. YN15]|uniref:hypothetical protein n=1 Tax=Paenibacillus sp. YN15 TaxID=1742774 RepID=UPI000DCC2DCE|nr:hypothetical protein [Paenibacillus sp. YN15]RAV06423.1 hypothetical protein DQG13_00880 [Paenibacillus sp. YN15]